METYVVKDGEHLGQIAAARGLSVARVWDHPDNADIREKRESPFQLMPGDEIVLPEREAREESCATEQRHRFRRLDTPIDLRLIVRDDCDEPAADMPYEIRIPKRGTITGSTSGEGELEARIPADAKKVTIVLTEIGHQFDLQVGALDPVARLTGVQQRLRNLGFYTGPIDGRLSDETKAALTDFQISVGMEPTGVADEETRHELEEVHDGGGLGHAPEDEVGEKPELDDNEDDDVESIMRNGDPDGDDLPDDGPGVKEAQEFVFDGDDEVTQT